MKDDFTIEDVWLPFEIHPDTPPHGVRWNEYFPGMDAKAFFQQLDARGRDLGVRFGPQPLMSNSSLAMQGGEFAKAHGRYDAYHEGIFRAFFTDCLDIGDRSVLRDLAAGAGLDTAAFDAALDAGAHQPRLEETTRRARELGISSAPTFLVDGYGTITGAQPIKVFQAAIAAAHKNAGQPSKNLFVRA